MVEITVNGTPWTFPDDFTGGQHADNFPAMVGDLLADTSRVPSGTSLTANTIGTGAKTFTLAEDRPLHVGGLVVVADAAAPGANRMYGTITARAGLDITVTVTDAEGAGTKANWTINATGLRGPAGGEQVGVSATDTTPGTLDAKIAAGANISLDTLNPGANEVLEVSLAAELKGVTDKVASVASVSGVVTLDCSTAHEFTTALAEDVTSIVFTNVPATGAFSILWDITQDAIVRAITWPAAVLAPDGSFPALDVASGKYAVLLRTLDGGTTWFLNELSGDYQ
ncbi:MAG: hypothetical protein ACPGO3_00450 [Magnetospiraceae bacterium]